MQPLEALILEEKSVVDAEIEGQRLSAKSRLPPLHLADQLDFPDPVAIAKLLPHAVHRPYFGMLVAKGQQIKGYEAVSLAGFPPQVLDLFNLQLTQGLSGITQKIRAKYGVEITPQDLQAYLVGFACRILDYAKSNLAGLVADTPTVAKRFEELVKNRNLSSEQVVPELMKQLQEPTALVAYYIEQIKRFHDNARDSAR